MVICNINKNFVIVHTLHFSTAFPTFTMPFPAPIFNLICTYVDFASLMYILDIMAKKPILFVEGKVCLLCRETKCQCSHETGKMMLQGPISPTTITVRLPKVFFYLHQYPDDLDKGFFRSRNTMVAKIALVIASMAGRTDHRYAIYDPTFSCERFAELLQDIDGVEVATAECDHMTQAWRCPYIFFVKDWRVQRLLRSYKLGFDSIDCPRLTLEKGVFMLSRQQ